MSDSNRKSILKTISWRITGTTSTFFISYFISGSFSVAGTISLFQMIINTFLYYLHERIWNRTSL